MLKIGSHNSINYNDMLLGSVKEAISNGANCMMVYTGAPQNTKRKNISEFHVKEAQELLKENNISLEDVIIHAPFIINLGNTQKPQTFYLGVRFLKQEIHRVEQIGAKYIVLHPGAHVGAGKENALDQIVKGLDLVLSPNQEPIICLETMAGKGSEVGTTFEDIKYIIDHVKVPEKLGVCLDTCHINDAGYDLDNFEQVLDEFDEVIGLDKLKVVHVNDSKNERGSGKDRHANIGYGTIGFDNLMNVIYNPRLEGRCMILETPLVNDKTLDPYKTEIAMIRDKAFNDWLDEEGNTRNV